MVNGLLEHCAILFGSTRQPVLFTRCLKRTQELLERGRLAQFTDSRSQEFPFSFAKYDAEINLTDPILD